jgi:hypothetical protein
MKFLRRLFAPIKNLNSGFTEPAAILHLFRAGEKPMLPDLLYVVLALGVFALFALALEGCERLCVQANMINDYVIGGAVAVLLLGYLGYALSGRRSSEGAPRWPPTSFRSSSILLSSSPARHSLVATWRYSCLPA